MSESMIVHVISYISSFQIWTLLERLFATNSRAKMLQLRLQLQSTKKGSLSINDYFLKMRAIADTLTSTGQSISDDELLLYILGGLGSEYDQLWSI